MTSVGVRQVSLPLNPALARPLKARGINGLAALLKRRMEKV